ncbi:MAG: zinc ribbon domain-containing protein [Agathobacter sp.]|nr:zinc ribbon domain-containing protein [Agathobacter sp.]
MSKCIKCGVTILDDTDQCPLCRHVLKREGDSRNTYPDAIGVTRRFRFVENLVLFLSLLAAAVLIYVNYVTHSEVPWCLVAILILFFGNAVLRLAVIGKTGYMFKTLALWSLALILLFGIDRLTGYHGWSLDYVLPGGIMLIDLAILVLMCTNARNWQSYMMAQLLMILISVIPLILVLTGVIHFPLLTVIAAGISVFLFLGTLIIGDARARTELKRRFHI